MTTVEQNRKDALDRDREATEKSRKDAFERLSQGKPTPTQEENDRAKMGEYIEEHEDDGSGPEQVPGMVTRQTEAKKPSGSAGYSTRAATPAPQRPAPTKSE